MTEAEWLACTSPTPMLDALRGKTSNRKLRLFAVACCRRVLSLFPEARSRTALDMVECFADGVANEADFWSLLDMKLEIGGERWTHAFVASVPAWWHIAASLREDSLERISELAEQLACVVRKKARKRDAVLRAPAGDEVKAARAAWQAQEAARVCELASQSDLLRDVLGNPFRPIDIDACWNNAAVAKLAQAIYAERELPSGYLDAVRLAILADALEDAGCTNVDILSHCRSPGPHVRGCWVVDLLLGKE